MIKFHNPESLMAFRCAMRDISNSEKINFIEEKLKRNEDKTDYGYIEYSERGHKIAS